MLWPLVCFSWPPLSPLPSRRPTKVGVAPLRLSPLCCAYSTSPFVRLWCGVGGQLCRTGIFSLLPWCVGGVVCSDLKHLSALTLHALLQALTALVSGAGQHASSSADSIRHRLSRVRASGVLLRPIWKNAAEAGSASSSSSSSSSASASKSSADSKADPKNGSAEPKRKLRPAVEQVFTDIFQEFATVEVQKVIAWPPFLLHAAVL